ncbi:MAG: sodium:solute symporter [Candidatus Marinimicrobia bacterium]|nr:sodium:solute symporter [Candidatus Neomarinimicrobiota bacterium]MCF7839708.1 sodium:solute symporter [Candidatus Neomarinimicrobiota bacterium]
MLENSGFQTLDIIILVGYLVVIAAIGSFSGGKQRTIKDYFMGGSNIPWWAVTFAIVAAETSTLTFISIPGLAYVTDLTFLQLTIGYLIARVIVSFIFLPAYKKGNLSTAYHLLENRFGHQTRSYASTVFLFTRVAADGVRLFATAIPIAVIFKTSAFFAEWSNMEIYVLSIVIIAIVTLIYTYTGGVKGIIWVDVIQMTIYIGGAILAGILILNSLPNGWQTVRDVAGPMHKFKVFNFDFGNSIGEFFRQPYTLINALIGGTFLSMASHGTDQLIVQRLLTTRTLRDSQKALIGSGVMVMFQFALFLTVGVLLYVFFQLKGVDMSAAAAPFHKADEIFPYFIINYMPTGVKGIIIAGLFAAAMSTLAGSMSSLSSSAMMDLYKPYFGKNATDKQDLWASRMLTIFWAVILSAVALLFINVLASVVEIALGIASITYGGLLGTFLLGVLFKGPKQTSAIVGFSAGIAVMLLIILIPMALGKPALVNWTWYTLIGTSVTLIVGNTWHRLTGE